MKERVNGEKMLEIGYGQMVSEDNVHEHVLKYRVVVERVAQRGFSSCNRY